MKFIIGYKKEMTQIFTDEGNVVPCTIIDTNNVKCVGKKHKGKDGYEAILVGIGKKKKPSKSEKGKYKKINYVPEKVIEFRVSDIKDDEKYKIGDEVDVGMFEIGDKVKVTGTSKGKGFQGVVKRWGFKGGNRTHGQSDRERAPGSIGGGTDPGRVFKGKKMPGHTGDRIRTILNMEVVKIDRGNGLLCLKGGLPGGRNSIIKIVKQEK